MSNLQQHKKTAAQRGASRQAPARGARRAAVQKTPRQWHNIYEQGMSIPVLFR